MAFLFCDGFDAHASVSSLWYKWTFVDPTYTAFHSTSGRFGGGTARLSANNPCLIKNFSSAAASLFLNFAFLPRALPASAVYIFRPFDALGGTGNGAGIRLNPDGTLAFVGMGSGGATVGTSTNTVVLGQWNYISLYVKIADAGGRAKLLLNGSTEFDFTGDTKGTSTTSTILSVAFYGVKTGVGNELDVDDISLYDETGSFMNTQITADFKIETLRPSADDGAQEWTTSTGSNHAALVDETAVDTSDYIYATASGDRDQFTMTDLGSTPSTVHAVVVNAVARRTDVGAKNLKVFAHSSASDSISGDLALSNNYATYQQPAYQDPNGPASWTGTTVNGASIGVEVGT